MLREQEKGQIIVERSPIQNVSYTVKIPAGSTYGRDYFYVHIDVEESEDGFVHSMRITTDSTLYGEARLSNIMLQALFELFKRERLYVRRDGDGV